MPQDETLNSALSRNIEALRRRRHEEDARANSEERLARAITRFSGSMRFVYFHLLLYGVWIVANLGWIPRLNPWDPSFVMLAMVASVEAIFLSTFILISQNRQAERSEVRSQIDFENNLRAEIWSVHIGQALGIDPEHVEDVISQTIAGYVAEGHLARMEDT